MAQLEDLIRATSVPLGSLLAVAEQRRILEQMAAAADQVIPAELTFWVGIGDVMFQGLPARALGVESFAALVPAIREALIEQTIDLVEELGDTVDALRARCRRPTEGSQDEPAKDYAELGRRARERDEPDDISPP